MSLFKNWLLSALVLAVVIFFTRVSPGSQASLKGLLMSFICAAAISTYSLMTIFLFLLLLETVYGHVINFNRYMNVFYTFNFFMAFFFVANAKNSMIKKLGGSDLLMLFIPLIFLGFLYSLLRYWSDLKTNRRVYSKTRGVISLLLYGVPVSIAWSTGFILVLTKSVSLSLRLLGKAPI